MDEEVVAMVGDCGAGIGGNKNGSSYLFTLA